MDYAIFGAQGHALSVYDAYKMLYPDLTISFFVVSSLGGNAPMVRGTRVRELREVFQELSSPEKEQLEVLVATPEDVQPEIERSLRENGFNNYKLIDSDAYGALMEKYHRELGRLKILADLEKTNEKPLIYVYKAVFHKDRKLKNEPLQTDNMFSLQVGAANTDIRIADHSDNEGINISSKNVNYCELTGLYWIWKNRLIGDGDYFGLMQYRRMLALTEEDHYKLKADDVDVVLPYPLPYEPDINAHHKRYIKDGDWDALFSALKELQPEYAEYFPRVLGQQYLYNYNVILAKKSVLNDYCKWLFPILERTEELSDPKGCDRSDRYIGYMGETLETLYFMKNAERLNICHTACKMFI